MDDKIKILFYNLDSAGVNYFRTLTPAMELERNHSDEFYTEINPKINFNDPSYVDYLKKFDIIHYHRQLLPDIHKMVQLKNELNKSGTQLIVDYDDNWELHNKHPMYSMSLQNNMRQISIDNLNIANYITTTTDVFAEKINGVVNKGREKIGVFYNSIDPTWMKQFQNNWEPDPDGLVRITYMAGSSHMVDIEQLRGVVNYLNADPETRGKFKIIIAGWDTAGSTTDISFNQKFGDELKKLGLWSRENIKIINKSNGDVNQMPFLSHELKEKYRDNVFNKEQRNINSDESVYLTYEKILTDNHNIIKNEDYLQWLMNFERNVDYENEENFGRRRTQKANNYANVLNETDIALAPLADNDFNRMKSNLKQVECWSRKLPIICSDIPPYNVHGRHMENCVLIPAKKNSHKYWKKYLKQLILDEGLRIKLGNQLHEDFKEKYHLANVTAKRAEFYKMVASKSLELV